MEGWEPHRPIRDAVDSQLADAIRKTFGATMRYYSIVPHEDTWLGSSTTSSWRELEQPRKRFAIWKHADGGWSLLLECDVVTDADDERAALEAQFAKHGLGEDVRRKLLYGEQKLLP